MSITSPTLAGSNLPVRSPRKPPSRKARHNAVIRARILEQAGILFRLHGYPAVSIDMLMAGAGLTRGAFYAHFASKAALLADVIERDNMLLSLLRGRSTATPDALWLGARRLFDDYLAPGHLNTVRQGCNFAALTQDAIRAGPAATAALARARADVLAEMARGQRFGPENPILSAALSLATGTVFQAGACSERRDAEAVLEPARETLRTLFQRLDMGAAGTGSVRGPENRTESLAMTEAGR